MRRYLFLALLSAAVGIHCAVWGWPPTAETHLVSTNHACFSFALGSVGSASDADPPFGFNEDPLDSFSGINIADATYGSLIANSRARAHVGTGEFVHWVDSYTAVTGVAYTGYSASENTGGFATNTSVPDPNYQNDGNIWFSYLYVGGTAALNQATSGGWLGGATVTGVGANITLSLSPSGNTVEGTYTNSSLALVTVSLNANEWEEYSFSANGGDITAQTGMQSSWSEGEFAAIVEASSSIARGFIN